MDATHRADTEAALAFPAALAPGAVHGALAQGIAWESIAEQYRQERPLLIRFLLRQGASFDEAQDAVHTAFLCWSQSRSTVRSPRAWLRTVAWRSYLRQAVRVEVPEEEVVERCDRMRPDWRTPLEAAELGEQHRHVLALLLRLPARQRGVMAWHLDGFSTKEIAEALGMREDAVRQNLARARRTLRDHLSHDADASSRGQ